MEILAGCDIELEVIEYLKDSPDRATIAGLIDMSDDEPGAFVREDGKRPAEAGADEVAKLLSDEPALMQRPIVVVDGKAIIARPPERLLELL
jgi:arsenate reductase